MTTPTPPINPTTRRGAPAIRAGWSLSFWRVSLRHSFLAGGCWLGLLLLGCSSARSQCFQPATHYGVGDRPFSVAVEDVNADGRADIITANDDDNNVSVLLGQSGGGFGAATNYGVGNYPESVAVGDVNADGRADIITANAGSDNVSVLLGQSGGGFLPATSYGVGNAPRSVAVGDVNADGRADIITANAGSDNVSVLLGQSGGGFGAPTTYGVGDEPASVAVGDVNADGRADIITANNNSDNVSVLLGLSGGGFGVPTTYGVGDAPASVAVEDVNADGRADIITANDDDNNVSVLLGQSGGGFGAATNYGVGNYPESVAVGDVNADGRADLVTANAGSDNVSVLLGQSGGGFLPATSYGVGDGPFSVAVGDVNADGRADLITANLDSDNVSVLLGCSSARSQCFQPATHYGVGDRPFSVAVGDVNADGRADIITANDDDNNVSVLLGQSGGGFGAATNYGVGNYPESVAVGDVNADGRADIITANAGSDNVSVLLGQSGGGFLPATSYGVGDGPSSVAVGDVNADGRADLITANLDSDNVSVLLGQSGGGFGAATTYGVGDGPVSVVVGDVNADGRADLVTANTFSDNVSVLLGRSGGGFGAPTTYGVGDGPSSVAVGDVNADGRADLITANDNSGNVSVLLGQVGGGFLAVTNYGVGDGPVSVALGDVNADGRADLVTANTFSDNVSVLLGQSGGGFLPATSYGVGDGPFSVAVGDVNADGRADLITANLDSDNVSVLFSSTPVAITSQPPSGSVVCAGSNVSVLVVATGSSPAYQWFKDGNPLSPPQTTPTLTLTNVQPNDAGSYAVVVTGACNSVTSTAFSLSVSDPTAPSLQASAQTTSQPISVTASGCSGGIINWLPQGGMGQATGNIYTVSQPGNYTLSATCSVSACTSDQSAPLVLQVLPAGFAITSVSMVNCQLTHASSGQYQVSFTPRYSGANSNPISFSVVNEKLPTTDPAPYSMRLYSDNPTITLVANQSGNGEAQYRFNWLAACQSGTDPNQTPTTRGIPDQTLLEGQPYQLTLTDYFTDPDGQSLTFSAQGLPAGLTLSGSQISGAPSTTGISSVSITALDPGGLSARTSFQLRVTPQPTTPSNFTIVGVSTVNCEVVSAGERRLTFTPQYAGVTGQPISFSVVNEKLPTTDPGPYSLNLYTDNPRITLSAQQGSSVAQYVYDWLSACHSSARLAGFEVSSSLQVKVLGNPVLNQEVSIEVSGAQGQILRYELTDINGQQVQVHQVEQASLVERQTLGLGHRGAGLFLLRVSTPTQSRILKLLKND